MENVGEQLARALTGAWRPSPEPLRLRPEDLDALVPIIHSVGAGGLVWRRLAGTQLKDSPAGRKLQRIHRRQCLQELSHECRLELVVTAFRRARLEPLVLKGWSAARLYAEPGLRPAGDIDLCVPPEQGTAAANILIENAGRFGLVDLHPGAADLPDRTWDDLIRRSRPVPLGNQTVRVLGPEDQVRHLCLHLLRHGAFWPLWLCDVAAALEYHARAFAWDYFLKGAARLTQWLLCVLGLARRLLDARIDHPSVAAQVPDWIVAAVLQEWSTGPAGDSHSRDTKPLCCYWRDPAVLLRALRRRWPNPIEAAFGLRASPDTIIPPAWYQFRALAARALSLPGKVSRHWLDAHLPFALHRSD